MIQLRQITDLAADYPMVRAWWQVHGFPPLPLEMLSTLGLIAQDEQEGEETVPLGAVWIYMASTNALAMAEWLVTNPEASPILAAKAVRALLAGAAAECAERGCRVLFSSVQASRQPALARMFEREGFGATDTGMTNYVKILSAPSPQA